MSGIYGTLDDIFWLQALSRHARNVESITQLTSECRPRSAASSHRCKKIVHWYDLHSWALRDLQIDYTGPQRRRNARFHVEH